ncbi:MAG: hypothetical protein BWY65_02306 [Firmicutes bacterium ADurb.Bin373]|nr:MAG: hypothetical protein BWY65_02306 [Firmicutes bacterium ADurb.Bin373]
MSSLRPSRITASLAYSRLVPLQNIAVSAPSGPSAKFRPHSSRTTAAFPILSLAFIWNTVLVKKHSPDGKKASFFFSSGSPSTTNPREWDTLVTERRITGPLILSEREKAFIAISFASSTVDGSRTGIMAALAR